MSKRVAGFATRRSRGSRRATTSGLISCQPIHGFDRLNELKNMPPFLTSFVAIRDGRLTAYTSAPYFWPLNHAVAETEDDMKVLLIGAANFSPGQPLTILL